MRSSDHWDHVYRSKPLDALSWYAPHLRESLRLIEQLCPDWTAAIVDIGGGESTLVDDPPLQWSGCGGLRRSALAPGVWCRVTK